MIEGNIENIKISVVMPAFNAEKFIQLSIESICNQSFPNFEFIIIDDGSDDETWDIIQTYALKDKRIKAIKNKSNEKICKTLNKGISIAKGKYIARMDADDWSYPDRLEKQFDFMEKNEGVVISGGSIEICDESLHTLNMREYKISDEEIRKILFRYSPFAHPAVIYKKEVVQRLGGYNNSLAQCEDLDLYFRLGLHGKFSNLEDVLLKYRTHKNSTSIKVQRYNEKLTLYSRLKAVVEYGYHMTITDKIYFACQYLSMFLIPKNIKFWLFNFLRKWNSF